MTEGHWLPAFFVAVLLAGTGADLRRLSHKRAGEILETKFGMDPTVVAGIARWDRIDTIRR